MKRPIKWAEIVRREGAEVSKELLDLALAGDAGALSSLVRALRPVIQSEVTAVLARSRGAARGRPIEQDVNDFIQEVFANLFADGAKELRRWQPAISPLKVYVRGVAYCDAISLVRSRTRSPYTEDATAPADLDSVQESEPDPENSALARDLLDKLVDAIRDELAPRGSAVFELLVLREQPVEVVCHVLGMTEDAVYAWKSRIAKLARKLRTELLSE